MTESIHGNIRREAGGFVWFEPMEPLGGVGHVVMTTRHGGQSAAPYDSLNFGFHVGDVPERVRLNRTRFLASLGRKLLEPVVGEQVHGINARTVGELRAGTRWQANEKALADAAALVTGTRYLPLVTMVADCVPVALVDPVRQVGAVVHAGWRGLSNGVLENTLGVFRETWGSLFPALVARIGPAIGSCCYEVGPDVAAHFPYSRLPGERDRSFLDLRSEVRRRLAGQGLIEENVTGLELCTSCHPELFFSHRRATREGQATTGRQALLLWLERASE